MQPPQLDRGRAAGQESPWRRSLIAVAVAIAVIAGLGAAASAVIGASASRTVLSSPTAAPEASPPGSAAVLEGRLAPGECWLHEVVEPADPDLPGAAAEFAPSPGAAITELARYAADEVARARDRDQQVPATDIGYEVDRAVQRQRAVEALQEDTGAGDTGADRSLWTVQDGDEQVTAYARVVRSPGAGWQVTEHAVMLSEDICERIAATQQE